MLIRDFIIRIHFSILKINYNILTNTGGKRVFDPGRIRTCNLLIRSQTRYPLRHEAIVILQLVVPRLYLHF